MSDSLPMRELARLQSLQIKLGQFLVKSRLTDELRDDCEKLFASMDGCIAKLDSLHEQGLALQEITDQTARHDLRNVFGIARGYAELIKESDEALSASLRNLLDKVILWTNKSLQALENSRKNRAANRQIINSASHLPEQNSRYEGTVLILDDEPANRDLLSRYIEQLGLTCHACGNAEDAFNILREEPIDLILLDLIMPGMSGQEVLAKLKASQTWRAIPVIVISGLGDQTQVIRCIEAGAEDYLQKPFNRTVLQARLRAGLNRKQWVDTERRLSSELEKSHRFIKNTFGRYLSNEIVNNLLENPEGLHMGGTLQTVTILMADIRSFTTISEQLAPESVVKLLNNYLGVMADVIMEHGGTVDEFIGDAILALFGAPVTSQQDAKNATLCALAMQAKMSEVNALNAELGLPEIRMGIGLNTGEVVAGNIGSSKRAKYGVVGHAVNVTSRIEDQTRPGEILVSQSTLEQCGLQLKTGRTLSLQPKGISETVNVVEVNGLRESSTASAKEPSAISGKEPSAVSAKESSTSPVEESSTASVEKPTTVSTADSRELL